MHSTGRGNMKTTYKPKKEFEQEKVIAMWINTEIQHEKELLKLQKDALSNGSVRRNEEILKQIESARRHREPMFLKYPVLKEKFDEAMQHE